MKINYINNNPSLFYKTDQNSIVFLDALTKQGVKVHWLDGNIQFVYGENLGALGGWAFVGKTKKMDIHSAIHKHVGGGIAHRDVWHFITSKHCEYLRAGVTMHTSLVSSTPHTFELAPEPGFEELFWFRISDGGKALIEGEGLWPDGSPVDAAWPVRDGDVVQVPMGSHRVVALPDVDGNFPQVSYVWCYLCKEERWEK